MSGSPLTVSGGVPNLGTVFRMTLSGDVTVLHAFPGGAAGASPQTALVQASDGQFYGSTSAGLGTLFRMTPSGIVTTLPMSGAPSVIWAPTAPLVEGTDHKLYGATTYRLQFSPHSLTDCAVFFRVSAGGAFEVLSSPSARCPRRADRARFAAPDRDCPGSR